MSEMHHPAAPPPGAGRITTTDLGPHVLEITLDRPAVRNALLPDLLDGLDAALDAAAERSELVALVLSGAGPVFCAGFDLAAAVEDETLLGTLVRRLGSTARRLRRLPAVTIAAAHGAAVAGGCALVAACDFAVVGPQTKLGYPVHRIGLSPAVTIPALASTIGPGPARDLLLSGRLVTGNEALRLGLASHLADDEENVAAEARDLAERLARHGHHALRTTKAWLNTLDGSLEDEPGDRATADSAEATASDETGTMLRAFWDGRRDGSASGRRPG